LPSSERFNDDDPVANERRSLGRAEDVPPPPAPLEPGFGVARDRTLTSGGGNFGAESFWTSGIGS